MEIFNQKLAVHVNNKRWKRGSISVPVDIMDKLGWENQEVIVAIFKPEETVNVEVLSSIFEKYQKMQEMKQDLLDLKECVMDGEK